MSLRAASQEDVADAIAHGAIQPFPVTIRPQSTFDSALLEQAIIPSNNNGGGVGSDGMIDTQIAGKGVALASDSQAPAAVFLSGGGVFGSQALILKPGAVFWPGKEFTRIQCGLPFGWLGGGTIRLMILKEKAADFALPGPTGDMVFQRTRHAIFATTDNPASRNANWPSRFPWPSAVNNLGQAQNSQPIFGVIPTRVRIRLRKASLGAGGGTIRSILAGTEDFDLQVSGTAYDAFSTSGLFEEFMFPSYAASGFQINGVVPTEFPEMTFDSSMFRTGGDSAVMTFIDMATPNVIGNTNFLDVIRYGVIG